MVIRKVKTDKRRPRKSHTACHSYDFPWGEVLHGKGAEKGEGDMCKGMLIRK